MPQYLSPETLTSASLARVSKLARDALVRIDSKWKFSKVGTSPADVVVGAVTGKRSPRVSPLNPRTAGSIISPHSNSPSIPAILAGSSSSSSSSSGQETSSAADSVAKEQAQLRQWILQMPTHLLQDVVQKIVELIEADINDDKDRKIILTLINIEKTNPSHFSFGVYSLLICLAKTRIAKLPFSTKLWFCIWEFEQLTTSNHLRHCLSEAIPQLSHLTAVNFAYIATDQIMYLLCKNCPRLEEMSLDHSSVSDRCVRFLCGTELQQNTSSSSSSSSSSLLLPSSSKLQFVNTVGGQQQTQWLKQLKLASTGGDIWMPSLDDINSGGGVKNCPGCPDLKYISLQGCSSVTDFAVWFLLEHKKKLQVLRYHQAYSVAEILSKRCMSYLHAPQSFSQAKSQSKNREDEAGSSSSLPVTSSSSPSTSSSMTSQSSPSTSSSSSTKVENRKRLELALRIFDHPFPYGLDLKVEVVKQISLVCPSIVTLNLVSMDSFMPDYVHFGRLTKVALEMEDCFGLGLHDFFRQLGNQLTDVTLSCSSDADSTFLEGGGQPFQLFNVGLKLARKFCPNLTHLNVSGCGLVSNQLLDLIDKDEATPPTTRPFQSLRSLIMLTYYDDDVLVQTCQETLLMETLQMCTQLECLSLEGNFSSFLNDAFLARLMRTNPLDHLRIFDVRGRVQIPLSLQSAKALMALPKIRELRMFSWNVSDRDIDKLKDQVKLKGWDLLITNKHTASVNH